MNKNFLTIATALFIGGSLLLTSCKKDETGPVITLTGDSVQTISLNATLTDPGATADDEKDGAITAITSDYLTVVNKDLAGTYTVSYTAADSKDNSTTKTRTVIVKNDASSFDGSYKYTEVISGQVSVSLADNVVISISPSTTVNNEVTFQKFANYVNATVKAQVTNSNTLTILSQTLTVGTDNTSRTFNGNGSRASSVVTVNFSDKDNSVGGLTVNCVGTYTKQ